MPFFFLDLEPTELHPPDAVPQPEPDDDPDEDDDRESNGSERSTSGTPPTPSNGMMRYDCTYCEASFGSFFLMKQHEQVRQRRLWKPQMRRS